MITKGQRLCLVTTAFLFFPFNVSQLKFHSHPLKLLLIFLCSFPNTHSLFSFFFFFLHCSLTYDCLFYEKEEGKKKKNSSESRVQHGRKGAKRAAANNVFYITILTYCSAGGILSSICQRVFQRLSPSVPPLFFFLNIPLRGGLLVLASRLFLLLFFFFCLFVSYSCVLLLCCVMACFSLFVSFRYFPIVSFFLLPLS